LLLTGIRKNELLRLETNHVYLSEEDYKSQGGTGPYFWITTSKQRQPFGVPITPSMKGPLERAIGRAKKLGSKHLYASPRPNGVDKPIANLRHAFAMLTSMMGKLSQNKKQKIGSNVLRTTFASAAYHLGLSIQQINMITGHTGSVLELNRVATGAYLTVTAEAHRQYFDLINMTLMGDYVPTPSRSETYR